MNKRRRLPTDAHVLASARRAAFGIVSVLKKRLGDVAASKRTYFDARIAQLQEFIRSADKRPTRVKRAIGFERAYVIAVHLHNEMVDSYDAKNRRRARAAPKRTVVDELLRAGGDLTHEEIAEKAEVSDRYVRKVAQELRNRRS